MANANSIRVLVVSYPDRKNLMMRYLDPFTNKQVARTTGTTRKRDAERKAAVWQAELEEDRYHKPSLATWDEFREKYELEIASGLADSTASKISGMFSAPEAHINPQRVRDLTPATIDHYKAALRKAGKAESTINGHLAHLKAALGHAVRWGMIPKVPDVGKIVRAKNSKVMKGRPITTEEFERMIDKVSSVVGDDPEIGDCWKYYLRGLWWSGLRLGESLNLSWDDETKPRVDLTTKRPVFLIRGEHEKGNKDRELPMAPEFARFLSESDEDERTGFVFNPKAQKRRGDRLTKDRVSRIVCAMGKAAGVIVDRRPDGSVKYASSHDLRRAFGLRWAYRINSQSLMRHEAIETTMKYYVGQDAQNINDVLWQAEGNISGNTVDETEPESKKTLI